jgi:Family of unknown function (DUF5362)
MESTTPGNLFELQVDHIGTVYLRDAARWARFLAIAGFIFCGLFVVAAILFMTVLSSLFNSMGASGVSGIGAGLIGVVYIGIGVLNFFPCLYLYKFASRMQAALSGNDQEQLNSSFLNMRAFYRFVGVLMIIALGFWLLSIVVILLMSLFHGGV